VAETLLAIDVGGTFTDAVLADPGGRVARAKAPTTPRDRTQGVREAAGRVLRAADVDPGAIDRVVHGTTTATNALLEGEGARTALVTNEGFEDVLEIGRQARPSLYDLDQAPPQPLVPRDLRFGVSARMGADGQTLAPVDRDEVAAIADEVRQRGVDAVAVGLLHAHRSAEHERAIADLLETELADIDVVTSAGTSPEPREVERLTTTVVNAMLTPLVGRYLDELADELADAGITCPVRVLDSAGATVPPREIADRPVTAVLSGPAGGAAANRRLARAVGEPTVLGVDVGGTSTDVSLVQDGEATTRWRLEVAGRPLQVPAADVHTIGAGGGSIAGRDEAGGLRVGPESAGADPGPACYGRGGTRPTVTDANLVLDRIPPSAALAGELELDREAAREAIATLGEDVEALAAAILDIAVARTARGLRTLVARHAVDPEQAALAAFGGAGPQFGAAWARRLGFDRLLVPAGAGVTSAEGLLAAPARVERAQGLLVTTEALAAKRYEAVTDELAREAQARLPGEPARLVHLASARYAGQSHELTVTVPDEDPARIGEAFEARHADQHGYTLDEPVEVVAVRVRAEAEPALAPTPAGEADERGPPTPTETVETTFVGHEQPVETPVVGAEQLSAGACLPGPAIVTSPDTTTLVPPDAQARVLGDGTLELRWGQAP
jgi:N-methylhydantoinase A